MKTIALIIFGILSIVLGVGISVRARLLNKDGNQENRILSKVHIYTIAVFAAVLFVFIPIYYTSYPFGDSLLVVRPFLIAIHNSFRIFILDGDFDIIVKSLADQSAWLRVCYSLYAAVLYVVAPVLTFTNVLSLFKNVRGAFRYHWNKNKTYYIMSELNAKSIALAKSIRKKYPDAVIVFTDVFEQNEEKDYELLTKARKMNAICLKRDIAHVDIISRKGPVEVFLIGNDESENVSQAVRITSKLNKKNTKHNVKVFVFSTKPGASHIVDSIKYDNLLKDPSDSGSVETTFKLRRIDEKRQLIWNTMPDMRLFELADRNHKTLSVMIAGFGSYGEAFFKTLVWYCQFEGYKLKIHILDKRGTTEEGRSEIEALINRNCPELLKKNRSTSAGDAQYDIEIFPGVDVLRDDLQEMITYEGTDPKKNAVAQRLKSTNLAFVSLGDDDLNIEASIYLRSLFDRVKGINAKETVRWEDEVVDIYSVVFDEQKSKILYNKKEAEGESHLLVNHKNIPYHIHFIGSMSSQFDYGNIYDQELETKAMIHHNGWAEIEERIYNEWKEEAQRDSTKKDKTEDYRWDYSGAKDPIIVKEERIKYEQYEFYRLSSIAKALYQSEIASNPALKEATTCLKPEKLQTCKCENCLRRKRSEHNRWNAYMRVIGFSHHDLRADRAMRHPLLCDWAELDEKEWQKD